MRLAALQSAFQAAILAPEPAPARLLARFARIDGAPPDARFAIYHEAYRLRLIEALGASYERLRRAMAGTFVEMAGAFIAAHVSVHRNLRWYGEDLPDFLAATEPWSRRPDLAELAALERNLNIAFDAPDAPALTLRDLAAHDPTSWPDLVFAPHGSARRLEVTTDVLARWHALGAAEAPPEDAPEPPPLPAPVSLLTWRQEGQAMVRALPPEEEMMWIEMSRGRSFGQQCTLLAVHAPDGADARAAGYLGGWIQSDLLAAPPPQ